MIIMNRKHFIILILFLTFLCPLGIAQNAQAIDLKAFHTISSHDLPDYVTELSSDKYRGRMIGPGVPYTRNYSVLAKWEPYSYHRYKFQRAKELGAIGLLYVGLTANPNTSYLEDFVYAHISEVVAEDLLEASGKKNCRP